MNSLTDIFVLEGESVTLECNYVGFPAPNITWTFNNSVITNDSSSGISIVIAMSETNGSSRLSLSSNTREGNYSCMLSNVVGTADTTYIVQETSKFEIF